MMEPRDKIRHFIAQNLTIFSDNVTFTDSDDIFKMGFVDSLFALKLVKMVEAEFGLVVGNQDLRLANFSSVDNIVRFITSKRAST